MFSHKEIEELESEYRDLYQQERERSRKQLENYKLNGGMVVVDGEGDPVWEEPYDEDHAAYIRG